MLTTEVSPTCIRDEVSNVLSRERRSAVFQKEQISLISEITECILITSYDQRNALQVSGAIDDLKIKIHRHDIAEKNKKSQCRESATRRAIYLDLALTSCLYEDES